MHLKFYLGHPSQKYGLQNGSYTYDIGMVLLGDMRYTSLDPTLFYLCICLYFAALAFEPYLIYFWVYIFI